MKSKYINFKNTKNYEKYTKIWCFCEDLDGEICINCRKEIEKWRL